MIHLQTDQVTRDITNVDSELILPFEVLGHDPDGVKWPHITDGVATLVGGPKFRIGGARGALSIGQRRVGLQGMAAGRMMNY